MFSVAPSLMCADLLRIESQVHELERAGARRFHVDIMDGHFVPNLGLNFDLVRQLKRVTGKELDLHLMVDAPENYVEQIRALNVHLVSFHIEATSAPRRLARAMKATGARTGIALNPSTPIHALHYVLDEFDYVVVMTVEPGFAGQRFIPAMYEKILAIRETLDTIRPGIDIEVDGNLDVDSSRRCIRCGATILVGGTSSIFLPDKDVFSAFIQFQNEVAGSIERAEEASPA